MDILVEALNGGDHNVRSLKTGSPVSAKKNRIVYDKDFLVDCFKHPASTKKPAGFPLPNLECTLGTARSTKMPSIMHTKRKEEMFNLARKEKEPVDSISLRPQSGSFASGCAANLTSAQQSAYGGRFLGNDEQSRLFYEREFPRPGSSRFANVKLATDASDRARADKEKERAEKKREGRAERGSQKSEQNRENRQDFRRMYQGPGGRVDDLDTAWNRKKTHNGNANRHEKEHMRHNNHHDRERHHREKQEDAEPEWFSEGPTSRLDTIELRGFNDDIRNEGERKYSEQNHVPNNDAFKSDMQSHHERNKPGLQSNGYTLDNAAMLSMSYIDEEKTETDNPTGNSRFLDLFHRNSKTTEGKPEKTEDAEYPDPPEPVFTIRELKKHFDPIEKKVTPETRELGRALRTILLGVPRTPNRSASGSMDKKEFVKMIESLTFRKQVLEEEKFAKLAMERKKEDDETVKEARKKANVEREAVAEAAAWEKAQRLVQLPSYHITEDKYGFPPSREIRPDSDSDPEDFEPEVQPQPQGYYYTQQQAANFVPSQVVARPGGPGIPVMMPQHAVSPYPLMPAAQVGPGQFIAYPPQQTYNPSRVQMGYPYPYQHPAMVQNSLQIFQDQVRLQHWGAMTPLHAYSVLTPEHKKIVDNSIVNTEFLGKAEVHKVINDLSSGAMTLADVVQQLVGPQQPILAGVLHYALENGFQIAGVNSHVYPPPPPAGHFRPQMHFVHSRARMPGPVFGHPMHMRPQHRPQHGVQMVPNNMAFMPTSVMRKMTAEQQGMLS